jgi:hypothetical protein
MLHVTKLTPGSEHSPTDGAAECDAEALLRALRQLGARGVVAAVHHALRARVGVLHVGGLLHHSPWVSDWLRLLSSLVGVLVATRGVSVWLHGCASTASNNVVTSGIPTPACTSRMAHHSTRSPPPPSLVNGWKNPARRVRYQPPLFPRVNYLHYSTKHNPN